MRALKMGIIVVNFTSYIHVASTHLSLTHYVTLVQATAHP